MTNTGHKRRLGCCAMVLAKINKTVTNINNSNDDDDGGDGDDDKNKNCSARNQSSPTQVTVGGGGSAGEYGSEIEVPGGVDDFGKAVFDMVDRHG